MMKGRVIESALLPAETEQSLSAETETMFGEKAKRSNYSMKYKNNSENETKYEKSSHHQREYQSRIEMRLERLVTE